MRDNFAPNRLKTEGETGELNLIATKNEAGDRVILKAVNPSAEPLAVTTTLGGAFKPGVAKMNLVAPGLLQARKLFAKPDVVAVKTLPVSVAENRVTFTLPPYSAAVVGGEVIELAAKAGGTP